MILDDFALLKAPFLAFVSLIWSKTPVPPPFPWAKDVLNVIVDLSITATTVAEAYTTTSNGNEDKHVYDFSSELRSVWVSDIFNILAWLVAVLSVKNCLGVHVWRETYSAFIHIKDCEVILHKDTSQDIGVVFMCLEA